ncbi:MAG TPA: DUF952 domain-containing protein [Hyphomicrobium sp.]|nr:DUF952 domain-containing protein [Hyphomicrobium sp.]
MTRSSISDRTADVFKIVPAAHWRGALAAGAFDGSADDIRDGYIHLSTAEQVPGTLAKYFRDQPDLLIVGFASADFGQALKWEPSRGGALFPHIYGSIPVALALWQRTLPLGADGIPHFDKERL